MIWNCHTSAIDDIDERLGNLLGMLKLLGLDAAEFSRQNRGRYFMSAIPACLNCRHDVQCREWLGRNSEAAQRPPVFCPNAQVLIWAQAEVTLRWKQPPAN
jgi:hypothetical protein